MGAVVPADRRTIAFKSYRFVKLEADLLRNVPKVRGKVEVQIKTSLGPGVSQESKTAFSEVDVVVVGLPAPDDDNLDPIFRIHVVIRGVYDLDPDTSGEELMAESMLNNCAFPLYTLAVGEVGSLASKLTLPRFKIPLTLSETRSASTSAVAGDRKPVPKPVKKPMIRKTSS